MGQQVDSAKYCILEEVIHTILQSVDQRTGFLPSFTPVQTLGDPYDRVVRACTELRTRYHGPNCNVRPWLNEFFREVPPNWLTALDFLEPHFLEGLMTKVSLLAHAFRWGSMPTVPENYQIKSISLPINLERLWTRVAERLGTPRVGIFYTMVGNNWKHRSVGENEKYDPNIIRDQDIELIHSWLNPPEQEELRTFVLAALGIEAKGAKVLRQIQEAYRSVLRNNPQELTYNLLVLEGVITQILEFFVRQIKATRIKPADFLKYVQPTMLWLLDEGEGPLEGASGPQACTIQVLDSFFGVSRSSELGKMLIRSRKYMLPKHRSLIETLDKVSPLLRHFVDEAEDHRLKETYNRCLQAMKTWRISHQKRGALFLEGNDEKKDGVYASTGLLVSVSSDRVATFENSMETHIEETKRQMVESPWAGQERSLEYLFRYVPPADRKRLADRLQKIEVVEGDAILTEGDRFPGLFMLRKGRVAIVKERGRESIHIATISEGELFGEISLIGNIPASATVRAVENVELDHISVEAIYDLVAETPRIEASIYLALAQLLSHRLQEMNLRTALGDKPIL